MSDIENLPFHRKYRPNSLKNYVGNKQLKETIQKSLASGKKPQTILLYGNSGCGKTTMARIIAKEYLCENRDEENGACGECVSCTSMDEYIASGVADTIFNVKEIDIGANSGKGDIESVLEDATMQGFGNEWKIYIFDEVQRASDALQTRLLKITEEPPENVLFIFCTTNPEKLLDTLKNRCQLQLKVNKPTMSELRGLLKKICDIEDVKCDNAGLELLCNRAEFTIRTSLQMLKQVIDEHEDACYVSVSKTFESVSTEQMIKFFKYLTEHKVLEYVVLINEIKQKMELDVFVNELKNFAVKGIYLANSIAVEGITKNETVSYTHLFADLKVEEVSTLLNRLLNLNTYNLEMDLLLLGYQGIKKPEIKEVSTPTETNNTEVVESKIEGLTNEMAEEMRMAQKVIEQNKEMESAERLENTENYTREASMEEILAKMGGSVVH